MREWNNEIGAHMNIWQQSYYGINQINLILEAIEQHAEDASSKKNLRGQNLFLRALFYHNLARCYAYDPTATIPEQVRGGVPITEKGVIKIEDVVLTARAPIEQVYEFIYRDLEEAYRLLEKSGNEAPFFATQGAVAALFSRVALYNGDYQKVIQEAQKAIESEVASFPGKEGLEASWRSEKHPESFFEIAFTSPDNIGSNESLRATYMTRTTVGSTTAASHGNIVLSEDLRKQYRDEDLRLAFVQKGLKANANRLEINKFASKNGVPNLDNVPVIRYAEILLNLSEAYAMTGQFEMANVELNKIRERAGLPRVSLQGQDLLDEILLQRRIEFAFEGHRFFDLKRLGMDIPKESLTMLFTDPRVLSRIPVREVEINPNLIQNFGY